MLVGVKYCGGCNPRYDRGALVAQIKKALPAMRFEPVRPDQVYDVLLVVSGCHVQCADISGIQYRRGRVGVYAAEHLTSAVQAIQAYEK